MIVPTSDPSVQQSLLQIEDFPFSVGLVELADLVSKGVAAGVGYISLGTRQGTDDCACITAVQKLYLLITKD